MEANKRIGDYEILGELGSGGMGRVFLVRNVISDRVEAMKVLLPDLVGRQDLAARFLREIKVLAALTHPNIAALRTALTADNQLVMIMEYVEGQSVASRLAHGPIATADALTYVDQVLDALSYAHAQHVIHRDIKPANMMLTPQGVVKLTDFGIARSANDQTITVAGTTTGSLSYMSPEQVNGDATDPRSDLYSVGVSLYEMVTGQRPFHADSDFAVMLAHLKEMPRPPIELQPALAPGLNEIILKSIAKSPADRFQSADEFRQALRKLSGAVPGQTTSRNATVLASALAPTMTMGSAAAGLGAHALPPPPPAVDHPRTLLDTATPSPRSGTASRPQKSAVPVAQAPTQRRVHPGLYMAAGAVLVIGAMIGTGFYMRKAEGGTPSTTTTTAPAPAPPAPAPPTPAPVKAASTPVETPVPTAPVPRPAPAKHAAAVPAVRQAEAAPDRVAPTSGNLDQVEQEIDQLTARAAAVNNSLDRLQQEQARQGLGLRGDMAARQQSMKLNLQKAQDAIEKRDSARATRFKDLAESDVEALEKFLGR